MTDPTRPVRTVDRTLEIVETVRELDGASVSEIADRVDIGASAVHNHLATLVDRDYVTKEGDTYHLGLAFLSLGVDARNRTELYDLARHEVDRLAAETGELVNLLVERDGVGIYLYQAKGAEAVDLDTDAGKRVRLHCTAPGKAILAYRPRAEVADVLDRYGLPRLTERTITDRETLFEELDVVRERTYATDREERLAGLCCVAAPITDGRDRSVGAVSVSCPLHRVDDDRFREELPPAVLGTANVIELAHNYS